MYLTHGAIHVDFRVVGMSVTPTIFCTCTGGSRSEFNFNYNSNFESFDRIPRGHLDMVAAVPCYLPDFLHQISKHCADVITVLRKRAQMRRLASLNMQAAHRHSIWCSSPRHNLYMCLYVFLIACFSTRELLAG